MRPYSGLILATTIGTAVLLSEAFAAPAPTPAAPAANAPTPRTADGRPDFTGMWRRTAGGTAGRAFQFQAGGSLDGGGQGTNLAVRDGNMNYLEIDAEFLVKSSQEMPQYKPEYWEEVRRLEEFGYRKPADPMYGCHNPGVVRLHSPAEVVQLPNKMIFIYTGPVDDGTSGHTWVRQVPTDGRPLPGPDEYEGIRPTGVSSGRWEGDTLVIETVDFPAEQIWYNTRGWIASPETKVTERLRREGDTLFYDITVDDPMFVKPWVKQTQLSTLEKDPKAILLEPLPCIERDGEHLPPT
jgi:hypothetical protein